MDPKRGTSTYLTLSGESKERQGELGNDPLTVCLLSDIPLGNYYASEMVEGKYDGVDRCLCLQVTNFDNKIEKTWWIDPPLRLKLAYYQEKNRQELSKNGYFRIMQFILSFVIKTSKRQPRCRIAVMDSSTGVWTTLRN